MNRDSRLKGSYFSLRDELRTMDEWVPIIVMMLNSIYYQFFKFFKKSVCQYPMRRVLTLSTSSTKGNGVRLMEAGNLLKVMSYEVMHWGFGLWSNPGPVLYRKLCDAK